MPQSKIEKVAILRSRRFNKPDRTAERDDFRSANKYKTKNVKVKGLKLDLPFFRLPSREDAPRFAVRTCDRSNSNPKFCPALKTKVVTFRSGRPPKSDRTAQGGDFCSACQCQNARNKKSCKGLPFFRLPTADVPRCRQWMQNIGRFDLMKESMEKLSQANIKICAMHFENSQFTVPTERKRLNWNAVPTIFDVLNPPPKFDPKRPLTEHPSLEPFPDMRYI